MRVRRETNGIVLEAAGQRVVFDAEPARLGFLGIAVHGAGFVGIRRPQLLGKLTSPS